MKMNNQELTNEERQALIEHIQTDLDMLRNVTLKFCDEWEREGIERDIQVQEIALATLTAEPMKVPDELTMREAIRLKLSVDWAAGYNTAIAHCKELSEPIDNTAQQYEALAGWKMVPIEPTEEMLRASYREAGVYSPKVYRVMLEAAPKPEV